MKEAIVIAALFVGMLSLFFVSGMEYQDELHQQDHYCKMVGIWKAESHLPKDQRAGWPDFRSNYNEVCK